MSDMEKNQLIKNCYVDDKMSFASIAEKYGTYSNKIRRDAKKFNIPIRDKSEAQKNALETGIHQHPTKGKKRQDDVKEKIGKGVMLSWEKLSDQEIEARKLKSKQNWDNLGIDLQNNILKKANDAVRVASKQGSKLEKYLLNKLIKDGFKVEFHKEQVLSNTKLQIDLFLPSINTAIEVDGPSHFEPVWGQQSLAKNKTYDSKKEGLILGKGWKLIRIQQKKDFSKTRADLIYQKLLSSIDTIKTQSVNTISIEDQ
jgi:very-short-patch-repair endonuclease